MILRPPSTFGIPTRRRNLYRRKISLCKNLRTLLLRYRQTRELTAKRPTKRLDERDLVFEVLRVRIRRDVCVRVARESDLRAVQAREEAELLFISVYAPVIKRERGDRTF